MVLEGNWTECVRLEEKEVAFNASSGVPTKDAALSVSPDPLLEVLLHTFFFRGSLLRPQVDQGKLAPHRWRHICHEMRWRENEWWGPLLLLTSWDSRAAGVHICTQGPRVDLQIETCLLSEAFFTMNGARFLGHKTSHLHTSDHGHFSAQNAQIWPSLITQ